MIRKLFLPSVAVCLILLSSCTNSAKTEAATRAQAETKHQDRKPAPDFTLKDANGNEVKLSGYRGRAVLLNFWATWCGPCALEIPWFVDFQRDLQSKGLEVVGVSMDTEGWSVVKPFVASHKMNYRVLLGDDTVGQLYGVVDSLPTSFIIDKNGKIAYVHVGLAGRNEYLHEIQSVLGIPQQTTTVRAPLRVPVSALFRLQPAK